LAAPELGAKQLCPNCQAKFYDLNRRPAHCPKCENEFDPDEALKSRRVVRGRAAPNYEEEAEDKVVEKEADEDEDEAEEATPEIDAAVEAEPLETDDEVDPGEPAPAPGGDDLGVDFEEEVADEDDEAAPFLEDEEDDLGDDELEGLPDADEDDQ
jgi:uncharacterized protein (TIGR02300 family)